jgi:hypothetical protein
MRIFMQVTTWLKGLITRPQLYPTEPNGLGLKQKHQWGVQLADQSRASSRLPNWTRRLRVQISGPPTHFSFGRDE